MIEEIREQFGPDILETAASRYGLSASDLKIENALLDQGLAMAMAMAMEEVESDEELTPEEAKLLLQQ